MSGFDAETISTLLADLARKVERGEAIARGMNLPTSPFKKMLPDIDVSSLGMLWGAFHYMASSAKEQAANWESLMNQVESMLSEKCSEWVERREALVQEAVVLRNMRREQMVKSYCTEMRARGWGI